MALKRAAITCELREVLLRDKPEAMMKISKKGTVPILQLPDGKVIDESLDVMLWALNRTDPNEWLKVNKEETMLLINENDFKFKEHLDRYKYFTHYPEKPQIYYRECAEEFLCALEQRLSERGGEGMVSERITLADVALFPFIRQFARVDWEWFAKSKYKILKRWLEKFENCDLFLSVMNKYKPWKLTDEAILIS
jgi:glutathione S-transferase